MVCGCDPPRRLPQGTALLSHLAKAVAEADDLAGPLLRALFAAAMEPYLAHLRAWVFSPQLLSGLFCLTAPTGTAGGTHGGIDFMSSTSKVPPPSLTSCEQ